jgi:hypothetical protein
VIERGECGVERVVRVRRERVGVAVRVRERGRERGRERERERERESQRERDSAPALPRRSGLYRVLYKRPLYMRRHVHFMLR